MEPRTAGCKGSVAFVSTSAHCATWGARRRPRGGWHAARGKEPPKSPRGERVVELSPATVAVLESYRAPQAGRRLVLGDAWAEGWPSDHVVIDDGLGRPLNPEAITRRFDRVRVRPDRVAARSGRAVRDGAAERRHEPGRGVARGRTLHRVVHVRSLHARPSRRPTGCGHGDRRSARRRDPHRSCCSRDARSLRHGGTAEASTPLTCGFRGRTFRGGAGRT